MYSSALSFSSFVIEIDEFQWQGYCKASYIIDLSGSSISLQHLIIESHASINFCGVVDHWHGAFGNGSVVISNTAFTPFVCPYIFIAARNIIMKYCISFGFSCAEYQSSLLGRKPFCVADAFTRLSLE